MRTIAAPARSGQIGRSTPRCWRIGPREEGERRAADDEPRRDVRLELCTPSITRDSATAATSAAPAAPAARRGHEFVWRRRWSASPP